MDADSIGCPERTIIDIILIDWTDPGDTVSIELRNQSTVFLQKCRQICLGYHKLLGIIVNHPGQEIHPVVIHKRRFHAHSVRTDGVCHLHNAGKAGRQAAHIQSTLRNRFFRQTENGGIVPQGQNIPPAFIYARFHDGCVEAGVIQPGIPIIVCTDVHKQAVSDALCHIPEYSIVLCHDIHIRAFSCHDFNTKLLEKNLPFLRIHGDALEFDFHILVIGKEVLFHRPIHTQFRR